MSAVRERPILFSGEMVRAILDGRKTQTRRVVKNPEHLDGLMLNGEEGDWCPFGHIGDRLWVRETFCDHGFDGMDAETRRNHIEYRADCEQGEGWSPSIHMPRWASRLTLGITGVRVERLNEITDGDGRAEGYESAADFLAGDWATPLRESNPWVWVIEFLPLAQSELQVAQPCGEDV